MRGEHLPDKGNIRTIRFLRPSLEPKRMEAPGFVSKNTVGGKAGLRNGRKWNRKHPVY
jgi:hypothetical protein